MKTFLLLLALCSVACGQTTTVRFYATSSPVDTTWAGDGANTVSVGDYTWSGATADFNQLGWEFTSSAGTSNPDLRGYLSQFGFLEGDYVFTLYDDGNGDFQIGVESEPQPPPPDPDTLGDWWISGWNFGLGICGFGLLLRVVKGLRGPGSGEI